MKRLFVFSVLTAGSLTASVAAAQQPPCTGNFGITYPNRCAPPTPTPDIPDEAFAPAPDVYVEVAPAPVVQPVAQAPAPCAEAKPMPAPLYQPRLGQWASQGKLFDNPNRIREVGVRSLSGDGYGASAYLRTRRANSRLGLEASIDAVDAVSMTQLSLLAYTRPVGSIKPYGFVGAGAYIETPGYSAQAGFGAEMNLTPRVTINMDIRYLVAEEAGVYAYDDYAPDCFDFDCYYNDNSFEGALVSVGLGYKFGAINNTEKTLFRGNLLRQSAATGFSSRSTPAQTNQPGKYTYSTRWNQGFAWNNSRYLARWNQPPQAAQAPAQAPSATQQPWRLGSSLRGGSLGNGLTKEVGARSYIDMAYGDSDGGGLYFKTQRDNGRLGGEVSLDFFGDTVLGQGALLGYLNPRGVVKPYGLLGAGINIGAEEGTVQWGAGVSADVGKRVSLSGDVRGIEGGGTYSFECDADGFCYDNYDYFNTVVGSVGVGVKF
jgi:hypothetical protein